MNFIIILLAIAVQIFLTAKKVNPFLSLILVAIGTGLCLGIQPEDLVKTIERGVSGTMGGLALIIFLGAVLGKVLEISGAADKISATLIGSFGEKNIQWAVLISGFIIGIPLFFSAAFVILVPLVFTLARKTGLPLLYIGIPMAASLSTTHCFLPPHPGPVVLVNAFKADMGVVLVYGIAIAIPTVIVAGPLLGRVLQKIKVELAPLIPGDKTRSEMQMPGAFPSFAIALLPIFLISFSVLANYFLKAPSLFKTVILFTGNSTIALLISAVTALYFFGLRKGYKMETVMTWLSEAISGIAMIVLIITAGGVFKEVLVESGTGQAIAAYSTQWQMPPLLFAWVVTGLVRVAVGSATVAGITAAGIVAPLVTSGAASAELMVLAVGSGSVFGSHINDAGFWTYKEFFKLSLKQTFLSWTIMETSISILGLIGVLLLSLILS